MLNKVAPCPVEYGLKAYFIVIDRMCGRINLYSIYWFLLLRQSTKSQSDERQLISLVLKINYLAFSPNCMVWVLTKWTIYDILLYFRRTAVALNYIFKTWKITRRFKCQKLLWIKIFTKAPQNSAEWHSTQWSGIVLLFCSMPFS